MTMGGQVDYLGFLLSQTTSIEQEVYQTRYRDIQYPRLVPVDMSANEWARTITHFSMDMQGNAGFAASRANDIPLVDVTRQRFEVNVEMAWLGYDYTIDELGQAMMIPGRNLTADKAMAVRRKYEEFIDDKVLNGYDELGWDGLLNNANIPAQDAPNGAAGTPQWNTKTGDEVIADINGAITGVWDQTGTVELADTIALGATSYAHLGNTPRSADSDMSILRWLQANNLFTLMTGEPLNIVLLRGLEDAAAGDAGRLLAYRRAPDVLKLHLPKPLTFETPQRWLLRYVVPAYFRLGGLEIRLPRAMRYLDLIST